MKEYTLFVLLLLIVGLTALLMDRVHESFESGSTASELTLTDIELVGSSSSSSSSQDVAIEPIPADPVGSSSSSQRGILTLESEPASVGSSSSSMMGDISIQPVGSSSSSMRTTFAPAETTTPPAGPPPQQQQQQQRYGSLPYGNVIIINPPTNPNSNNTAYRNDILPQEQPQETSPTDDAAQPTVASVAPEAKPLSTSKIVAATAFGAAGVGVVYMFMKG